MNFQNWLDFKEGKRSVVKNTDIDRWLNSVDGLAKELTALEIAKEKAKIKMSQIKDKKEDPQNKPEDKVPSIKPDKKENPQNKPEVQIKPDKKEDPKSIQNKSEPQKELSQKTNLWSRLKAKIADKMNKFRKKS